MVLRSWRGNRTNKIRDLLALRRKFLKRWRTLYIEPLESRVLLSVASDTAHALATPLSDSLLALGNQTATMLADAKFNQPVPGLLAPNLSDPAKFHTPSARDLLSIPV